MSGTNILFPRFRDEQADSRYPFADYATLAAVAGNVSFQKDVFVDASFYPIGGGTALYISQVTVAASRVTIYATTVNPVVTISASYDPVLLPEDQALHFYDEHGRPAGIMIFNRTRLPEIYQWGYGTYTFDRLGAEFVSTVFVPAQEPGVRALKINETTFITDDVWLVGDNGVVLSVEDNNTIRVDVVGVPLFARAACEFAGKNKPAPRYVATINGCTADEFGNFTITATSRGTPNDTTVLRVYPAEYGLIIDAAGRSEI